MLQAAADRSAAQGRLDLWGDLTLADPWFLLLLPIGIGLCLWGSRTRGRVAASVPRLPIATPPKSLVQHLSWLPQAMRVAAVCLTVLALARPLRGRMESASQGEGVDIALLLDCSSSMEARASHDQPQRFEVAKEVVGDFAVRRMTDEEGIADNVALFIFAGFAELICPFTLDAKTLTAQLDKVRIAPRELDGTGIGVAITKVVEVFQSAPGDSKIAVLLTDGEETINVIDPLEAAQLAAEEGIKVYTVFAGPRTAYRRVPGGLRPQQQDTTALERIAEITGARFFHAETGAELEEVYAEIETLERRKREDRRYAEHFDLYPRLLMPAALLYIMAWLSLCTWARRLP